MPFDIEGARSAGYSDAEIAGFMAQREGFDMDKATKAGYQPGDVIGFLSERSAQKAGSPALAPTIAASTPSTGTTAPITAPKAERTKVPEGSWADPREGSWDDRSEMRKGVESAVTGLKAMAPAAKVAGSSLVINRIGERLANWDKVDKGEYVPRSEALAYQQADAAGRQKLREDLVGKAAQQKEFIGESVKLVKQYQQEQQRNKGATSDFTDIENVKGFSDWLAFNGAAGAVYLAPVMLSAALGGPVGAGAMSYGLAAGEINSDRVAAAIDMNRPGRFKNPDRQQEVDPEQGIANRVASTVPSTLAFAAPNAALDVVSGPVRNVLTKPLHGLTRRETLRAAPGMIGRDIVEEGVTGGLQEVGNIAAERYVGEQQGDAFTAENAKRVVNAATAEAAGGLMGGSGHAGISLMTAPSLKTPEQVGATVMSAPTVDDAIRTASSEAAAPIPTPPAAAAAPVVPPASPAARPEAAAAVDRIGQILGQTLGQTLETPDVGRAVAVPPVDPSSGGSGLPAAAVSVAAGDGTDGAGAPAVVPGNAGTVATGGAVPQGTGGVGAGALEPQSTWFGRAGNGYATPEDAQAAIPSRERARADLQWKVEPTSEGRYRLAGYASEQQATAAPLSDALPPAQVTENIGAAAAVAPPVAAPTPPVAAASSPSLEAPAAPQPDTSFAAVLNPTGTLTIKGDPEAIRAVLSEAGITSVRRADGVLVGTKQADAAQRLPGITTDVAERGGDPFRTFLMRQGIALKLARNFAPGTRERLAMGRTFREGGMELDALAERAAEQGFISDRSQTDELYDMITRSVTGERIAPLVGPDGELELRSRIDRQRQLEEDAARDVSALSDESLDLLADPPFRDIQSNASTEAAMRALGFTDQEIQDAVAAEQAGAPEAGEGRGQPVEATGGQAQAGDRGREGQARSEGLSDEVAAVQESAGPQTSPASPARVADDAEGLTSPTPEDVVAQQDRRQQGERAEADRRTEEETRARADAQRDEFTLTGSERAADSNPAQRELSDPEAVTPTTATRGTPSESTPAADRQSQRQLVELRKRKSVLESLLTCLG